MSNLRLRRIAGLIRLEVSNILRKELNDSRIGFISITEVTVSADLKNATIYYSQLGSDKSKRDTAKALKIANKFIKFHVGNRIQLKTVPNLKFVYDDSLAKGSDIVDKLREL